MSETFLISDTHFGHKNILTFLNKDGTKLRPFETLDEMHCLMIDKWNSVVKPKDRVYHLGDVAIPRRGLEILKCLNGRKVLIKGNHDIFKLKDYAQHFDDIRAYWHLDKCLLAHIPVHPDSLSRWKGQFHGHLHSNVVMRQSTDYDDTVCADTMDERYFNVSVERINYIPITFHEAKKKMEEQFTGTAT